MRSFVKERVETWVSSVNCLAAAARKYPQSAYCALNRSLSCEWSYLQRVVQGLEEEFAPLRDVILEQFAPAILGREVLPREHQLLTLPVKYGGLALADPVHTAPQAYQNSRNATDILRNSIQSGNPVNVNDHSAHCRRITSQISRERDVISAEISQSILSDLPQLEERTLSRIVRGNASGWLTVLPLKREGYDLSSTEFRDQLAIRYGRQPLALPAQCDGCGKPFSLQHGLDCPKGGLIKRGHNDLRDSDAKLADMAFGGVVVEPIMVPEGDRTGQPALRADWLARGVWEDNRVAFFDNRIIDANAPSYSHSSWEATSNRAANAKKKKYRQASEDLRGSFTPLVCSTDGVLHREYASYQKRLAGRLALKWDKPFSIIMAWVRVRSQFAVIHAVDLRLRGSRRRLTGLSTQDGAGVGIGH